MERDKAAILTWCDNNGPYRNICLTAPCYTKEAVEYETRNCKLLICGSDQIWIPLWVNPILMRVDDWNKAAGERKVEGDYIFCYVMGSIRPYQMVLRELMKRYGVEKVVYIPSNLIADGEFSGMEQFAEAGPAEFLSLIKYAKVVCTDSFHGTVMSILYEKQFYNINRKQQGSEKYGGAECIENLLNRLEIQSRKVRNVKDVRRMENISYESVNEKVEKIRLETDDFWKNKFR